MQLKLERRGQICCQKICTANSTNERGFLQQLRYPKQAVVPFKQVSAGRVLGGARGWVVEGLGVKLLLTRGSREKRARPARGSGGRPQPREHAGCRSELPLSPCVLDTSEKWANASRR